MSNSNLYNKKYFDNYLIQSADGNSLRGQKKYFYHYFDRLLKRKLPKDSTILEVGCGLGFFGALVNNYFQYHAIDISPEAIDFAKNKLKLSNVAVGDATSLQFDDNYFDVLVTFDVVEHLENPELFFKEAFRVLKPGGLILFSTPNPESFGNRVKGEKNGLIPSMYLDKTHVSLWTLEQWVNVSRENGFSIVKSGTDCLWDIPYFKNIPLFVQKIMFIPVNILFRKYIGFLNWEQGENVIVLANKQM